ncbi:MAG: winged helix-turn-helix transcriptional regulator [Xanthomonadaceae bacterium]|nr:winged helix-turn-helix transcriptional regulator [Xanthomonadaceae bacterium]
MAVSPAGKPQGCTHYKLRQLVREVSHYYDTEIGKAGLKGTQYALMGHVRKLGPVRLSDLAREMRLDASTLTRNLKPLTEAGWLRVEVGADGRSRLVTITEAGLAKYSEAQRYWKRAQERINQLFGAEQVIVLHELIDELLARLPQRS